MLLDRPVIVIDCPELIDKAHVGADKVHRLRSGAAVAHSADEVASTVVRELKHPQRLSSRRRTIADELFYGAGGAEVTIDTFSCAGRVATIAWR